MGKHQRKGLERTARGYVISRICVVWCLDRVEWQLKHVMSVFAEIPTNWVRGGGG